MKGFLFTLMPTVKASAGNVGYSCDCCAGMHASVLYCCALGNYKSWLHKWCALSFIK